MPNNNKGGYKPKGKSAVPTRFRCKVGGEWKPLDAFSNSQRNFIQRQIDSRRDVNAAHSGMTCREHAGKSRSEIRCERCKLIKHIDEFSKNSRKNEVFECMRCVAWTETQEHNVTPAPLETGHISIEEQNEEVWQDEFLDAGDFFEEDALPAAPVTGLSSLGIQENELVASSDSNGNLDISGILGNVNLSGPSHLATPSVSGASTTSSSNAPASLPPHLATRYPPVPSSNASSFSEAIKSKARPSAPASDAGSLPPHLRRLGGAQRRQKVGDSEASDTASTASGFTRASSIADSSEAGPSQRVGYASLGGAGAVQPRSYANSLSTATTIREERERDAKSRQVTYNAWDAQGNHHCDVKVPTVASSSVSTTSMDRSVDDGPLIHGEWPKDVVPVKEPKCRGKNKWPKASESRLPQSVVRPQPKLSHVDARHINPEIDRQRRMNYCDSDDSDY